MAKKVYVGVGHGGTDPGAVGNGFEEEDLTLAIALACQAELTRHGVETMISRTTDVTFKVASKVPQANAYNPDIALDIHINAAGGKGAEVWYYLGGGASLVLAKAILDSIIANSPEKLKHGSGLKPDSTKAFGMINNIHAPSVLVECCFIDSTDVQVVDTAAEQISMGKAIAYGILNYFGIAIVADRNYTVLAGEGWWSIAAKLLGSGTKMTALATYNGMYTTTTLHPGQVIKVPN